jgi:two-component system cell cycle sensor histidine kinase/response regulator CckA
VKGIDLIPHQLPPSKNDLLIAAFECSEDAILVKDLDGVIQTWNKGAERIYGYREEEVVGRSALLLLPADRTNEEAEFLSRIRDGGFVDHFETVRLRKDGTRVSVSLTISPVRLAGEIVGASHIARKITERTLMESATAQLVAIVESSEDAIISKSLDGIVLTWNAGAERIYGYSANEIRWRPISVLLPADRANEETEILQRLKRGERVDHVETVHIRKDGKPIDVSLTISPIRDNEGRIRGASHIARDISERRAFQEQILQTQKLESIGVLAGGIAHDFNNLLSGILSGVSLARTSLPPDHPAYSWLVIAEQTSEKAADLTHQLLAYAGKGKFLVTRFDLSVLIRDMLNLLHTSIPKSVELQLALEDGLPWIEADASQIQQIIMNLVINGAESIGPEGGSLRVSTGSAPIKKIATPDTAIEVCMEVRDSGSGMTETTKARIFDPFFTTKFAGRGLGLAAVSGIVRGHGGRMQVESTLGEGSTFRICFPGRERIGQPREERAALKEEFGTGTILVVDDEPALRIMAQKILEHCGYRVLLAEDGRQAVEMFRENAGAITAILLDMTMPVMSGEEAFRLIRAIRAEVPIVVSTGYSEVATRESFGVGTVVGFVQKPYTAARLCERIRTTSQAAQAVMGAGR